MTHKQLLEVAASARANAYCPYSHYSVGAAILAKSGKVYIGCNIENAAYPACICAERAAIANAVSNGERHFISIAVTGGKENCEPMEEVMPCGECRQVLNEFKVNTIIYLAKNGIEDSINLCQILPKAFSKSNL